MHENSFWLSCWLIVASVVVLFFFTCNSHFASQRADVIELVRAGASPIEAWCTIKADRNASVDMVLCQKVFYGEPVGTASLPDEFYEDLRCEEL